MYICNKKQIIETQGEKFFQQNKSWLDECLNKEVNFNSTKSEWGICSGSYYNVHKSWCIKKD